MFKLLLPLLLLNAPLIGSNKVQSSLKNLGRRFTIFNREHHFKINKPGFLYARMGPEKVNATKWKSAEILVEKFVEISSTENDYFTDAFEWIETIVSENSTAEICGDTKKYNGFQWLKLMKQAAAQYKKSPSDMKREFTIFETAKDTLQVYIKIEQTDKNGATATFHYDVTLGAIFLRGYDEFYFGITHITQGGSCLEHGEITYTSVEQAKQVLEYLEKHPDGQKILDLFAPKVFKNTEDMKFSQLDVNHLPSAWLLGLKEDAKIRVPQPEQTEPMVYTKDEFLSWYDKLGLMWHPKADDDEPTTMQGLEYKDGIVKVRVNMKLQIGTKEDAPVHEWGFLITGEVNDEKIWVLTELDVISPITVSNIMDESYLVIRDVMGATLNLYVTQLKNVYMATDFTQHFKKRSGTSTFQMSYSKLLSCDEESKKLVTFWNSPLVGYWDKEKLDPIPAKEETSVELRIKMRPPVEPPTPGDIFGSDWKFDIKWDKMDQFYYFTKAELSCPKFMNPLEGLFRKFYRPCRYKFCGIPKDSLE